MVAKVGADRPQRPQRKQRTQRKRRLQRKRIVQSLRTATLQRQKQQRIAQALRLPKQARSRATLDRILDTAELMLDEITFDKLSINDLIENAQTSAGAFYARFASKEAVLAALYDRHQRDVASAAQEIFSTTYWRGASVAEIVEAVVDYILNLYRKQRGLYRTLVLRGHATPDWRYQDPKERSFMPTARIGSLLATRKKEIKHPDPALAGKLGFLMVLATLREKILFEDSTASNIRISDKRLKEELVRTYLSYLGVK